MQLLYKHFDLNGDFLKEYYGTRGVLDNPCPYCNKKEGVYFHGSDHRSPFPANICEENLCYYGKRGCHICKKQYWDAFYYCENSIQFLNEGEI